MESDCSHEIKRRLLLGRKAMTNLDSIWKSRDIALLTKVSIIRTMDFPISHVWMWELNHKEGWPPKNWCLLTLVLVKTQESLRLQGDKDFLKEINPEYLLEGLMLKLNLQSSGNHIWKRPWSWERLKEQEEKGMTEDEMVGWHHWLNWDMNLSKLWEIGKDREARCAAVHEVAKSWTQLSNWTSINTICIIYMHMYVHIYMNKCIIYLSHAPLHFKQYSIQPSSSLSTDPRSLSYYDLTYYEWVMVELPFTQMENPLVNDPSRASAP